MVFSIPSPYDYPVYLRDSVLNSNPNFDYGQFLTLATQMARKQALNDMTPSTFSFTFLTAGNYVFYNAADKNNLLIVSVKGAGEKCGDPDRYIQSSSADTLAALGISVRPDIIQQPNYKLFAMLIVALVVSTAIALSMIGYCLRKQWTIEDIKELTYTESQLET